MSNPPEPDEMEISLFGPGYGESVVLHVGNGDWVIVDSCKHPDLDLPTPIHYLKSLGVDVARQVRCVVASHWHDDHVSGIGRVVADCGSARFVCSAALLHEEFMTVMEAYGRCAIPNRTGIDELRAAFDAIESSSRYVRRAGAGTVIWHRSGEWGPDGFSCEIKALAPSDAMATASAKSIADVICGQGPQCRVPALTENLASTVLWVKMAEESVLLGGDLQERPHRGWSLILDEFGDILGNAFAYKVAHHGSENGHHQDVWSGFLRADPHTLLAPYIRGGVRLPKKSDVDRICRITCNGYITTPPTTRGRRRKRAAVVERVMRETMGDTREVVMSQGQIRIRMSPNRPDKIHVQLFGGAIPLKESWN